MTSRRPSGRCCNVTLVVWLGVRNSTTRFSPGSTVNTPSPASHVINATVPCPHMGYSLTVEKNRTSTPQSSTPTIKQVAGAPISFAICCISSSGRSWASRIIPATLPPNSSSEKASNRATRYGFMSFGQTFRNVGAKERLPLTLWQGGASAVLRQIPHRSGFRWEVRLDSVPAELKPPGHRSH